MPPTWEKSNFPVTLGVTLQAHALLSGGYHKVVARVASVMLKKENERRVQETGTSRERGRRRHRTSLGLALRVFRAETRLTVYRPLYMAKRLSMKYDNSFQFLMMI